MMPETDGLKGPLGSPWRLSGKCGGLATGSVPGLERGHVPVEQLSPWAMTTMPAYLEPMLGNERSRLTEKPSTVAESSPARCSQRKPVCSKDDPAQPQIKQTSKGPWIWAF